MINQDRITELLTGSFFGRHLFVFDEVDSTNAVARKKAQEGAPEGTAVVADYQTAGRGSQGRSWESSPGANILMSIILRPSIQVQSARCITLAAATILIRALEVFLKIEKTSTQNLEVKWPNDILFNGKKIAGILTESSINNRTIDYIITGIGINVNQKIDQLSSGLSSLATSMYHETHTEVERERLIAHILSNFEKHYIDLERTHYVNIVSEWKSYWRMAGRMARITTPVSSERGELIDINVNGSLLYKTDDGLIKELVTGTLTPEQ
jgi:BirA family biotin operon repressor/biotin-[acetyl-CoA-carboxylase] ligase